MKKQFELLLNDKKLTVSEFSFNTMIELEDRGVSLTDLTEKPFKFIRALISLSMDCSTDEAGELLEAHIVNGGNLEDIIKVVAESIEQSGFINALQRTQTAK